MSKPILERMMRTPSTFSPVICRQSTYMLQVLQVTYHRCLPVHYSATEAVVESALAASTSHVHTAFSSARRFCADSALANRASKGYPPPRIL
jgi:hypothetical protein